MKRTKIASLFAICLSTLCFAPASQAEVDAKLRQTLRDLCVLNLYMEGQLTNAHGGAVVSNLSFSGPLIRTSKSSFNARGNLKYAEGLSRTLLGENYRKAVATFMDHLASTVEGMSFASTRVCSLYDVKVYPGELQREVENPTFNELLPRIAEEIGVIDPNRDSSDQFVDAVSRFTNQAFQRNDFIFRELASMGSDLMDRYLDKGWENGGDQTYRLRPERLDLRKEFRVFRDTVGKNANPFFWDSHYVFPATPNTPAVWKWYAYPIPQIEQVYRDALTHIENGTFKQWWLK
jgi:hypothetical protein